MNGPTIGTHNTHDDAGRVTLFADAVGYTEAIGSNVREKVAASLSRARARLGGYGVRVCRQQRDLVFVARRRVWKITGTRYEFVHGGRAGVTPHRGTFVIETVRRRTRRPEVFLIAHRINAAFAPYVRGEAVFRSAQWQAHDETDRSLIDHYLALGFVVHALGDPNTPRDKTAWPSLPWEIGRGFDRIASTEDLGEVAYLGHAGSDHPRLRARLPR